MTLPRVRPSALKFLLPGLLLTALVPGCRKSAPQAEEEAHPAPVQVVHAETVSLGEWTELLGTTQPLPDRAARVSAAVEGRVLALGGGGSISSIIEGQQVVAGQVIAQLFDRVARANRDKLLAGFRDLEEQQKQADYAVDLATIEVHRLQELGKSSSAVGKLPLVSKIELQKAELALKDAESKQKSAVAKLAANEAELKALDEQLDLYTLRSPIAGRLGMIQVVPGQTLSVGTTVADVFDLDQIDVLCFVPPRSTARLALDQPARIGAVEAHHSDDVFGSSEPTGKIVFIAVQAHPDTGNIAVKVRFPNPDLRLRANTVARVQVLTQPESDRMTVPDAVLMEDQDPPAVLVVEDIKTEKDHDGAEQTIGKARKLHAVLGVRDRTHQLTEIVSLEDPEHHERTDPHDAVFVIEGGHGLEDDDRVRIEAIVDHSEK